MKTRPLIILKARCKRLLCFIYDILQKWLVALLIYDYDIYGKLTKKRTDICSGKQILVISAYIVNHKSISN